MQTFGDQLIGPRPYGLRIDTLVRLRWLAVAGQTATLLGVHFGLGFELPLWPALGMVALTALTNVVLRARKSAFSSSRPCLSRPPRCRRASR
jgi:two-component system, sensor histidine kinase RegB